MRGSYVLMDPAHADLAMLEAALPFITRGVLKVALLTNQDSSRALERSLIGVKARPPKQTHFATYSRAETSLIVFENNCSWSSVPHLFVQ